MNNHSLNSEKLNVCSFNAECSFIWLEKISPNTANKGNSFKPKNIKKQKLNKKLCTNDVKFLMATQKCRRTKSSSKNIRRLKGILLKMVFFCN